METIDDLKEKMYQEKLKKADNRFAFRLVSTVIISAVMFIIFAKIFGNTSTIVEWICLIIFIGIFLLVIGSYILDIGRICKCYGDEKDDALRERHPNMRAHK